MTHVLEMILSKRMKRMCRTIPLWSCVSAPWWPSRSIKIKFPGSDVMDANESWTHYLAPFGGIKRDRRSSDYGAGSAFTTTPVPRWPLNEDYWVECLHGGYILGTRSWWLDHVHKAILLLRLSIPHKTTGESRSAFLKITIKLNFYHRFERNRY